MEVGEEEEMLFLAWCAFSVSVRLISILIGFSAWVDFVYGLVKRPEVLSNYPTEYCNRLKGLLKKFAALESH
jgi:hypothetical protein